MANARELRVSGRMVLITLVAFFMIIAAVNALMATLAIRTFGGLEAENAYKAGLEFTREINAAKAQQLRKLGVDLTAEKLANGYTRFRLSVSNRDTATTEPIRARIELRHPADKRRDHSLILAAAQSDLFVGEVKLEPGQWNLRIFLDQGHEAVFRSKNRLSIP